MASAVSLLAADPLDDLFADPENVIAALVAALPAPAPDVAARVSTLLAVR